MNRSPCCGNGWRPQPERGGPAGSSDTYSLRLATDVYPNQPNVRRYTVELNAGLFAGPHFRVKNIGPFVLAIRNSR